MTKEGNELEATVIDTGNVADLLMGDHFDEKGELKEGHTLGDSSTPEPDIETVAETEAEVKDTEAKVEAVAEEILESEDPVVIAKDGKNTIPYSELEKTRESERAALNKIDELESQLSTTNKILEDLQAAKDLDEEAGGTDAVDELLADLEEEHPELVDGVKKLVDLSTAGMTKQVKDLETTIANLKDELDPIQKSAERSDMELHFKIIREAHEDFDTIADSEELASFVERQPSYVKDLYESVLEKGTAAQVNELLDTFKDSTGYGKVDEPRPEKEEVKSDGKEAEEKAKKAVETAKKDTAPSSLSDVPVGSQAVVDEAEAMLSMGSLKLMQKFDGKSPDEIEKLVSKVI